MEEKTKIYKISAKMSDPKGKLIPRGVIEVITINIADGVATYWFRDRRVTKNFATLEIEGDKAKGLDPQTKYIDRMGKAIKVYPNKTKEEIRDLVLEQLKKLGLNAKVKK